MRSIDLRAPLRLQEAIAVVELPCALDVGNLFARFTRDFPRSGLQLVLTVLELTLLLAVLRRSLLILHFPGARLRGSSLVAFPLLSGCRAASGVVVARTRLSLRRGLPAMIRAVLMIVLPALRLRR